MRKHFLAIVAIVLILAATACTQYPDDWRDYFPQRPGDETISTIEDLFLFASSNGSAKARINLTVDPDDPDFSAYFPMTIRGTKVLSGEIEVSETHRFPNFYSSTATPPRSVLTRAASGINLFEVADDANVAISDFSATVSDDAKAEVSSIIKVNNGSLNIQEFTVTTGTAAIEIGESATSAGNISGDLSSLTVTVNENNTNAGNIANEVADKTGATVDVGGTPVNEKYVAINTETYDGFETLKAAFDAVKTNSSAEIKLINDTTVSERIPIEDKTITFDLNGYTVSLADEIGILIYSEGTNSRPSLTINGGTYKSVYYTVSGNGTKDKNDSNQHTSIVINNGKFESLEGTAIYHPQVGDLTIKDAEIEAFDTAVEIRSGNLTIENGNFTATNTPQDAVPNGNGTTTTGAAIGIAQHTTDNPIDVKISGGVFNGCAAVYHSDPNNKNADDVVINITGGVFNAIKGGANAVESIAGKTGFIFGGTFNTEPNSDYIADGYHVVESGSNWTVLAD